MHGFTTSEKTDAAVKGLHQKVRIWLSSHRMWLAVVVLPTLLVASYYLVFAANQYESESHFIVRSADSGPQIASGLGQVLSMAGAATAQTEAQSVGDYLTSHDAVRALAPLNLVERFRRPEADLLSRLWHSSPTPETLLGYYRGKVDVKLNSDTGIMILKVRSFRPQDAYEINQTLLKLGEERVNSLNTRLYNDMLSVARRQLMEAEAGIDQLQRSVTQFRRGRRDIDPQRTGAAQTMLVMQLRQQLAIAKSQLASMGTGISRSSPQYIAMQARVQALASQVGAEDSRLTSGAGSIASGLGHYEELKVRQDFAAKRYEASAAAMEKARDQALRQQLFVIRVVEPNLPVKSLYPHRWKIIATVFFSLVLIYAIGWLIVAGMKEHAS